MAAELRRFMAKIRMRTPTRKGQSGFTLIELLISMAVLAIGMGGILLMFTTAMFSNNRNRLDAEATFVSQSVLEQLAAVPTSAATTFNIVDCANNTIPFTLVAGGAALDANNNIDWTASAVTNYSKNYVTCGNGTAQVTYEVRWKVITWNPAGATTANREIIVSSRVTTAAGIAGQLRYALPTTLRSINQTF
jgi:prepilin-type N-terminal cleavage/methylation domain-containing protein